MKPVSTIIFIVSIMALSLAGTSTAWAVSQLSFGNPVYDFNKVVQGKTVEHVFVFRNTGDAPVTIQRVGSSCGCTVATPSSRVINPGKSGEIKASFDSSDFRGPISKEVFVYTSSLQKPSYTLTMKGTVVEEITVTPSQLNLGEVKAGARKDGVLMLENKGTKTVRIKSVKSALPGVTATCDKKLLKPGEKTAIRVSLIPRGDTRFINGYIIITTDRTGKSEKAVPVYSVLKK